MSFDIWFIPENVERSVALDARRAQALERLLHSLGCEASLTERACHCIAFDDGGLAEFDAGGDEGALMRVFGITLGHAQFMLDVMQATDWHCAWGSAVVVSHRPIEGDPWPLRGDGTDVRVVAASAAEIWDAMQADFRAYAAYAVQIVDSQKKAQ